MSVSDTYPILQTNKFQLLQLLTYHAKTELSDIDSYPVCIIINAIIYYVYYINSIYAICIHQIQTLNQYHILT